MIFCHVLDAGCVRPSIMKFAVAATLVGSAAASCSGTADPVVTEPQCYEAKAGALGLTETVRVTVKDFASGAGHIDVVGSGVEEINCTGKDFTKSGQSISTDLGDCVPSTASISEIDYCSDQDALKVKVKVSGVPLPITTTASRVDCASVTKPAREIMWEDFVSKHAKNGDDEERKAIFMQNIDRILETNRAQSDYWFGVTEFADMTAEEFKSVMLSGLKPESERVVLGTQGATGAEVPDSIDWVDQGAVSPVKNQGSCGSCWAFSTVGALEGRAQIAKGNLQQFSEQQFVDCDTDFGDQGCNGGLMDNAFKYAEQADICTEDSYAYKGKGGSCAASGCTVGLKTGEVTGFMDVTVNDEQALMEAVAAGPVSVAVDAVTLFQLYFGGIMSGLCGAMLDHGVLVVGYGTDNGKDYWKVKNSWGSSWGEKGYVRMLRGKGGKGQCGILSGPPSYPVIGSSVTV
jgi:C1A family cysteine protease